MSDDDLRRASDPSTAAVDLAALAGSKNRSVQAAVALNPNAPLPTLLALASRHPDGVLANPAFDLHLLEHPDLLQRLQTVALEALARSPSLTLPVLQALASVPDERVRRALASHPLTPPSLLAGMLACADPVTRASAARRPAAPPAVVALLRLASGSASLEGRAPRLPPLGLADLDRLVALGDWGAELAAANPAAPPSLLERLASHYHRPVVVAVATNPSAPLALLRLLAADPSLAAALASNPSAPPDLLGRLAQGDQRARAAAAANRSTPPDALARLLGDDAPPTRRAAMANPSLPDVWRRRLGLAGFPGDLASLPARWIDMPDDDLAALLDAGIWLQRYVAMHPRLPVALCDRLCGMSPDLRRLTAMRAGLPGYLVARLRSDPDRATRGLLERLYPAPLPRRLGLDRLPRPSPADAPPRDLPPVLELLRAPSLRAPLEIAFWHSRPGDVVEAGQALVTLRQRVTGALIVVRAAGRSWVSAILAAFGSVSPAEPLAELAPWDAGDDPRPSFPHARTPGLLVPMPSLGESAVEGVISQWLVKPGDVVKAEQPVVLVGLDKCDIELVAPFDGVVISQLSEAGDVVAVGSSYLLIAPTDTGEQRS